MSISEDLKAYLEAHRRLLLSEVAQIDRLLGRESGRESVREARREYGARVEAEPRFILTETAPLDQEVLRRG